MKTTMWWIWTVGGIAWGLKALALMYMGEDWLASAAICAVCANSAHLETIEQALREMFCDGDCEGCEHREQEP